MNNNDMHANYIKYDGNGRDKENELGEDKSSVLAAIADEFPEELPKFELIPHGLILVVVAFNKRKGDDPDDPDFEAAIICDTRTAWRRVKKDIERDQRPLHYFLVKHEFVEKMAARPLEGS